MKSQQERQFEVNADQNGLRLDQVLAQLIPEISRARLQIWIREGRVRVDQAQRHSKDRMRIGERIAVQIADEVVVSACVAEPIALEIIHEDEAILVINKPSGLVVHPAAGHSSGTLQNALLYHCPDLNQIPRSGIVHRLDKLTSGLLVVAKTLPAHTSLVRQLQARQMKRDYLALVDGVLVSGGKVDAPIGRHPGDRKRMSVREGGRESVTHYRIAERFIHHTLLHVSLETGRTHQIRVHCAYIKHPITGDPVYNPRRRIPAKTDPATKALLHAFERQALLAERLTLLHPSEQKEMSWEAPVPLDFSQLILALRGGAKWGAAK